LSEQSGLFDGLVEGGFAIGLQLLEHFHVLFNAALGATFVEGHQVEVFGFGGPDHGLGESGVDFGMLGVDFVGSDMPMVKRAYLFTALNRNKIGPSNKGLNKNPRFV